jgi:hypothetical protein
VTTLRLRPKAGVLTIPGIIVSPFH